MKTTNSHFRTSLYCTGRHCNTQRRQDRAGKKLRWNDNGKKAAVGYQ